MLSFNALNYQKLDSNIIKNIEQDIMKNKENIVYTPRLLL